MTHAYVENWRNGRFWLWDLFVFEWAFLSSYLGFEVGFFTGDDARSVSLSFGCWLFALYFTIEASCHVGGNRKATITILRGARV
jgi:hypothetical protein